MPSSILPHLSDGERETLIKAVDHVMRTKYNRPALSRSRLEEVAAALSPDAQDGLIRVARDVYGIR